jgi:hypothetical protein
VIVGPWVVETTARWDLFDAPLGATAAGFGMQTFAVGAAIGPRLDTRSIEATLTLGPEAVVEDQEADGPGEGLGGSTADVRLDAALTIASRSEAALRPFGRLDVDASPARVRRARRLDAELPALPAWSAGVAVGLLWRGAL